MSFNSNGMKVDMVSEQEMTPEQRAMFDEGEASVNHIPNLDILTAHVLEIVEYIESPKNQSLIKQNPSAVTMMFNNKYADTVPYGIITLLMEDENRDENLDRIIKILEALRLAKEGKKSLDDAQKELTEDVYQQYEYSKYGSKEAFEKALAIEVGKERKKGKGRGNNPIINIKNSGKMSIKD